MEIYTTTNEPFWVTPSIYMDNTDTLYLGEQHCLVRNCRFFFLFVFPSMPVCQLLENIDGSFIYISTGFQSRGIVLQITGWLQGRLSLSSFRGRSNEHQEYLRT